MIDSVSVNCSDSPNMDFEKSTNLSYTEFSDLQCFHHSMRMLLFLDSNYWKIKILTRRLLYSL